MIRRRRWPGVLLVLAALLGGCGVSAQDNPQIIASSDVPDPLLDPELTTSTTDVPSQDTAPFSIYLVRRTDKGTRLVSVGRLVRVNPDPTAVLEALFAAVPTTTESSRKLVNSIPQGTTLHSTPDFDPVKGVLVIDLSNEITDLRGEGLRDALAQIVYTVTELDGVLRVRFELEGEPQPATTGDLATTRESVSRSDYSQLAPA